MFRSSVSNGKQFRSTEWRFRAGRTLHAEFAVEARPDREPRAKLNISELIHSGSVHPEWRSSVPRSITTGDGEPS